jgi:hypothetical protein
MLRKMSERLRTADEQLSELDAENDSRHVYMSNMSVRREWVI